MTSRKNHTQAMPIDLASLTKLQLATYLVSLRRSEQRNVLLELAKLEVKEQNEQKEATKND